MQNEFIRVFRAFADERRIRVLELLCEGEQCACVLLDDLEISQPTLSHHMKLLCESDIVKSRRAGKWVYYSINDEGCDYANTLIKRLLDRKMDSLIRIMAKLFAPVRRGRTVFRAHVSRGQSREFL